MRRTVVFTILLDIVIAFIFLGISLDSKTPSYVFFVGCLATMLAADWLYIRFLSGMKGKLSRSTVFLILGFCFLLNLVQGRGMLDFIVAGGVAGYFFVLSHRMRKAEQATPEIQVQ